MRALIWLFDKDKLTNDHINGQTIAAVTRHRLNVAHRSPAVYFTEAGACNIDTKNGSCDLNKFIPK